MDWIGCWRGLGMFIENKAPLSEDRIKSIYKKKQLNPFLVARLGVEPKLKASKASVLPLDDLAIYTV